MWLWHGTYDTFYKMIKSSGFIRPNIENTDTISKQLNTIINSVKQIRNNCVYLSNNIECMQAFDRSFRINTNKLDTTRLFVADNRCLDKILMNLNNTAEMEKYIDRYIKSYINFNSYIKNRKEYDKLHFPEFLYYGSIPIK